VHDSKRTAWLWGPSEVAGINDRRRGGRRQGAAGLAAILGAIAILGAAAAQAATTITVNSNADNDTDTSVCTLREAINSANHGSSTDTGNCTAGTGNDEIIFSGLTGTISLGGTLPAITGDLTIQGPSVAIDGGFPAARAGT
jgi:CSLREA domain-containing protein